MSLSCVVVRWFHFNFAVLSASFLSFTVLRPVVCCFLFSSRSNGSSPSGDRNVVRGGRQPGSPSGARARRGPSKCWGRCSSAIPGRDHRWDRKRERGRGGAGTRNLDQTDGLHHVLCGICCRLGQRVAVPVPLLQERWRWASEKRCAGTCWHVALKVFWIHKLTNTQAPLKVSQFLLDVIHLCCLQSDHWWRYHLQTL